MGGKPFLVCLNETFLTKAIENVELEGYQVLARRDRQGQWGGGILVFVLDEYFPRVTLVAESASAERIWAIVHSDQGPYLVCCWYRPPNPGNIETIESFETEYNRYKEGAVGVFVLGDLNVHSIRWLRHSARESTEGRALFEAASRLGLQQKVREPTRGQYLLDLVLTDVTDCTAKTVAAVADHRGVLTTVKFKVPETASHQREVWHFQEADWERLASEIEDADWNFLSLTPPSEGARLLTEKLLHIAEDNIPKRCVSIKKTTHPWLTQRGEEAVRQKHEAQGTEREAEAARECSETLLEEHYDFVRSMRLKLAEARPASKNWWTKVKGLMNRKQRVSNIPALKDESTWLLDAEQKANCFVKCFESKNVMIEEEANEYSEVDVAHAVFYSGLPTIEATEQALKQLDEDSALGPDMVPTRILKHCAHVLAPVLHMLIVAILTFAEWPALWMTHWIVPLYKRKSVYEASNYRGIHLTSQISKVAERVLAALFVPQLISTGAFGRNQFAYMPERGARDALAQLVLTWIRLFGRKRKVAVYCSDVSGAFDKVNSRRLLRKLRARGVPEEILGVIKSWLSERKARVAVGGKFSRDMTINNMVYQGTVLGPPLWNVFYADAADAVHVHDFLEVIFADDLNCFKDFNLSAENEAIVEDMKKCQGELHKWGRANQVSFDASKESMHILGTNGGEGRNFRLLGVPFDHALSMGDAVGELVCEIGWKLAAILRTGRFFTDEELVNLYKSQVLSYIEYRTAAIYHACDTILAPLDAVQTRFLRELGISEEVALFHFNLAPLSCRRDIAMLGLIHRCVLEKGPEHFGTFFAPSSSLSRNTRSTSRRHGRQIADIRNRRFLEIERRSALGLIWVYNRIPESIISHDCVKDFQRSLQLLLKDHILAGCDDWKDTLSPRIAVYKHPLR